LSGLKGGNFIIKLRKMEKVLIIPIGKIDGEILDYLQKEMENRFNFKVEIDQALEKPNYAFNPQRNQYSAITILKRIEQAKSGQIKLGIADIDLYIPDFNFVFGVASPLAKIAVISITRLRENLVDDIYLSLPFSKSLVFKERTIKEAIHELGHIFGLNHCKDPKCVMHFSNNLSETDRKSSNFCLNCQKKLKVPLTKNK